MAKQLIGIGSTANDGTGDNLRVGADKVNDNFNEIYSTIGDGTTLTSGSFITTTSTSVLTNKSIDLTDNPVTGTLAEFNTAVTDATLVSTAGSEVLTNKSIDSDNNTITNIVNADIKSSAAIAFSKMADLTASRALVSDGNGDVSVSAVTSTEIGFLDGVSSAIQTQLDTKTTPGFAIAQAVALG